MCVNVWYLCQCLYAGVNVTTSHLGDDKVDGGGRAVVEVIKVWRDRTHPCNTNTSNIKNYNNPIMFAA